VKAAEADANANEKARAEDAFGSPPGIPAIPDNLIPAFNRPGTANPSVFDRPATANLSGFNRPSSKRQARRSRSRLLPEAELRFIEF
jgi:hypothetical protein